MKITTHAITLLLGISIGGAATSHASSPEVPEVPGVQQELRSCELALCRCSQMTMMMSGYDAQHCAGDVELGVDGVRREWNGIAWVPKVEGVP